MLSHTSGRFNKELLRALFDASMRFRFILPLSFVFNPEIVCYCSRITVVCKFNLKHLQSVYIFKKK